MKVFCFNCYGICVARLEEEEIEKWNEIHELEENQKITFWRRSW